MEHNCINSTSINMSLPDYLDSLQQQTTLVMIPTLFFLAMLGVTGLVGNSLILVVFSRRFKSNPTNILLMTIASFDLVENIAALPVETYTLLQFWNYHDAALCKLNTFLNHCTTIGSVIALAAVSVVRYRKICAPHGWQVSSKQVKLISLVAVILGILLSIPAVVLYGPRSKPTPCDKILGHECYISDQYRDSVLVKINNGLYILLYVFFSIQLIGTYVLICNQVYKGTRRLKGHNLANEKMITSIQMAASQESLMKSRPYKLKPSKATIDSGKGSMSNIGIESAELSSSSITANNSSPNCLQERTLDGDYLNTPYNSDCSENQLNDKRQTADTSKYHIANNKNRSIKKTSCAANITVEKNCSFVESLNLEDQPASHDFTESSHENLNPENDKIHKRTPELHNCSTLNVSKERKPMTNVAKIVKNKKRSANRVTKILITITSIYAISFLVFLILVLIRNFLPQHYESMNQVETAAFHLFFRLYYLNCAGNCIVYGLCDPKFRRECLRLIRCDYKSPST